MDDTHLRSAFATLLADEPPLPTVADRLRAARRHRSRRRVTTGLGALAVVGVLGAGYGVAVAGSPTATSPAPADPPASPTAPPTPSPTVLTEYDDPDGPGEEARVRGFAVDWADGTVTPRPGITVLDTEVHRVGGRVDAVSVALVRRDEEHWYRVDRPTATGGSQSHSEPAEDGADGAATFAGWVVMMQELADLPDPDPGVFRDPAVTTDRYGVWTLAEGVSVVDEIDNPYGLRAPYTSAALTLRDETGVYDWVLTPDSARSMPHTGPGSLRALVDDDSGPSMSVSGPMPDLVRSGPGGMPVVVDGVEVLATVENPLGLRAPRRSVAFELRGEGRTWWLLWERGRSGQQVAQTTRVAQDGYADLGSWLADQKARTRW